MLDQITSQLSPAHRNLADRSIAATAGALFGLVVAGTVGLVTGRPPFALDLPMVTLYASLIPLSVAGFMTAFSRKAPALPILATLRFLAIFVPALFFGEVLLSHGELHIAGLELPAQNFIGFRAIVVAAMSGLLFSAIKEDGTVGDATAALKPTVDWQKRHDEAVKRLAMVDVELRRQRNHAEDDLAAFDRRLRAFAADGTAELGEQDDEWLLEVDEVSEAAPAMVH